MAIDKKELINTCLQYFDSHYQVTLRIDPNTCIDEEFLDKFFVQFSNIYGIELDDEIKAEIKRRIKASYSFYQDEGGALVGDYDHDFFWYSKLMQEDGYEEYYWQRYKNHLISIQLKKQLENPLSFIVKMTEQFIENSYTLLEGIQVALKLLC